MKGPYQRYSYDREPETLIAGYGGEAWSGWDALGAELLGKVSSLQTDSPVVIIVECYPGVDYRELRDALERRLKLAAVFFSDEAALDSKSITEKMKPFLTDDRVFGFLYPFEIEDFYIPEKLEVMRRKIGELKSGIVLVYGFGASLVMGEKPDYCPEARVVLVYADLARWEIQLRYRSGRLGNWKAENHDEDILLKYKRGFFIEWRMADRLKQRLFDKMDYYLDLNEPGSPKMIGAAAFLDALSQVARRPFRLVPYFDAGVWGGQWMKDVCNLDKSSKNYAWCFDGVPEENSLFLRFGRGEKSVRVQTPAINLVFREPLALLGEKVYGRFGPEFPIRFDFLDTMEGGNLSLQVHPLTAYIQRQFGLHYTQDESYYLLDAGDGAAVYLGLKEGVDRNEMLAALRKAQEGGGPFDAEKYVNRFPAKKHDHFLIPAGTIHCSGRDSMVLEISATPYIFTFKLWDWDRLGLDGKPRPVHINHGAKVIQWDRTAEWVKENLISPVEEIAKGEGWREERTGLHALESIETRRCWITKQVEWNASDGVNMLNLVEGEEASVESPENCFPPFIVHYAETFIVPAAVGPYIIRPCGKSEGKEIGVVKAYIR
jgi:mannose-6-phosphate isomerase class I